MRAARRSWVGTALLVVVASAAGCSKDAESSREKSHENSHERGGDHGAAPAGSAKHGGEHENEARLSKEAIERAGIRVLPVSRRALTGGAAVPADVQFDPRSTAHVAPLVPGRITKVAVTLGDRVRKGQSLGTVASTDVSAARSRLDQARARLSAAESTLERQQQLASEGIGAQRALIDAEAQVGELRAESAGLSRQLAVFGSGSAGELTLTTPIEGVVVAMHATLGETATPDQPAFTVTDPTKVWVRGSVPELAIERAQVGGAAIVRLHAYPDLALPGTITYVAPAVDDRTRALPIRVTLAGYDARLRGGLFGSVELIGGDADERVLVAPVDAVTTLDGQTVVFQPAEEENGFEPLPIAVGRRAGGFVEVRSGLQEGQLIAVSGAFTLKSALKKGELAAGHTD